MKDRKPTLPDIVDRFSEAFPKMDDAMRRIALSTYGRLARGVPALPEEIAAYAGRPADEVRRILGDWVGVYTDAKGRVIGFWGLSMPAMKHRWRATSHVVRVGRASLRQAQDSLLPAIPLLGARTNNPGITTRPQKAGPLAPSKPTLPPQSQSLRMLDDHLAAQTAARRLSSRICFIDATYGVAISQIRRSASPSRIS